MAILKNLSNDKALKIYKPLFFFGGGLGRGTQSIDSLSSCLVQPMKEDKFAQGSLQVYIHIVIIPDLIQIWNLID